MAWLVAFLQKNYLDRAIDFLCKHINHYWSQPQAPQSKEIKLQLKYKFPIFFEPGAYF